ncbi:hypothetical protein Sango_0818700 [Sesamum angolense]|uniref:Retrotransposon gag domain-containing protein n=1 Tax=Sesamum angolense TaxID=2727404 RepID=A0AAE1X3L9_9LAMI|nr:hypothetical protein Sango_0818700 [Sesamum angolense]
MQCMIYEASRKVIVEYERRTITLGMRDMKSQLFTRREIDAEMGNEVPAEPEKDREQELSDEALSRRVAPRPPGFSKVEVDDVKVVDHNFRFPNLLKYDGMKDPQEHVAVFELVMNLYGQTDPINAKLFVITLIGKAEEWFTNLSSGSIESFGQLIQKFAFYFASRRNAKWSTTYLFTIRQREDESLKSFMERFNNETLEVQDLWIDMVVSILMHGLTKGSFASTLARDPPEDVEELMRIPKEEQGHVRLEPIRFSRNRSRSHSAQAQCEPKSQTSQVEETNIQDRKEQNHRRGSEQVAGSRYVSEVQYTNWLSNVVIIPKASEKWRVCTDFTELNKAYPKDLYPLPRIDIFVDSTVLRKVKNFKWMEECKLWSSIRMTKGLFPLVAAQKKFMIMVVEYFSKWVEAEALAKISEKEIQDWCKELKIQQNFTEDENPQANGQRKVTNRILLQHLKTRLEGTKSAWVKELSGALWAYRTTSRTTIGETSFCLVYGSEVIIPAEIGVETVIINLYDPLHNSTERSDRVYARILHYKSLMVRSFQLDDLILKKMDVSKHVGKLDPTWEGPYEVGEIRRKDTYILQDMEGKNLPRPWNIQNLKKFYA